MSRSGHPSPIATSYSTSAASAPTPLWSGRVHLVVDGGRAKGNGSIELQWRPGPWIGWNHQTDELVPSVANADSGVLVPWGLKATARYQRTSFQLASADGRARTRGFLPAGLEIGHRRRLDSLVFHLVNFPNYIGEPVEAGNATWLARTSFDAGGWTTEVDWVADYHRLADQLRGDRGYALTHVGRIRRTDGSNFTPGQSVRFIDALWHLFGFVRGGWAGPALMVGRDPRDGTIWEQWTVKRVSPAENRHSFFINSDPALLARLAPGFMSKMISRAWREPFARAVALYVDGNVAIPIEIGILLAQAGLELLSWSTFVRSGATTPKDFESWPAARQFRELLSRAKVPMTVPAVLTHLAGPLPGLGPSADAAERIAYVRNRIVHPPRNRRFGSPPSLLIQDTWRLSLLFLELSLLHLAGYRGSVWSRVEESVVEVPW